jgi:hypothetical protein
MPQVDTALVPGRPVTVLICRYHGFNQPEPIGTLASSRLVSARPLAAELDAGEPVGNVLRSCPADFGDVTLLVFEFRHGHRLLVTVHGSGCRIATNGARSAYAPPDALLRLEKLVGQDRL